MRSIGSDARDSLKDQQKHFGVMDVTVLHGGHRHVSATHVAIFRVVRTRIQIYVNASNSLHSLKIVWFLAKIHGWIIKYEGWNINSGNYLFTIDTK